MFEKFQEVVNASDEFDRAEAASLVAFREHFPDIGNDGVISMSDQLEWMTMETPAHNVKSTAETRLEEELAKLSKSDMGELLGITFFSRGYRPGSEESPEEALKGYTDQGRRSQDDGDVPYLAGKSPATHIKNAIQMLTNPKPPTLPSEDDQYEDGNEPRPE